MDVKYKTLLMDPPWEHTGGGAEDSRGADKHYEVMPYGNIVHTVEKVLKGKIDDNAHLYLWVITNHLKDGWNLMSRLGFRYITNICWVKDRIGIGRYFRNQHELCFFGVKGRLPPQQYELDNGRFTSSCKQKEGIKTPSSVIQSKVREHSRKSDEMYKLIETVSPGPYIEIFARHKRPGWDVFGNQTDKFS